MTKFVKSLRQNLRLTFPPVTFHLLEEILKPAADFNALAKILALDPMLAATVLKLANSPVYAAERKVTDLPRAATILGTRELLKIAVSISFQRGMDEAFARRGIDFYGLWRQTIWGAIAAELLALRLCPAQASEAYIAALMKDLALLVALGLPSDKLPPSLDRAAPLTPAPGQAENEIALWRASHGELTAELMREWDFPDQVRAAVVHHHDFDEIETLDALAQCVVLATRWAEIELSQAHNPAMLVQFKGVLAAKLGLVDNQAEEIRQACIERFESILGGLGLVGAKPPERDYQRHSLARLQEYYLLSQELTQVSGGLSAAARAIGRHLKWNWDLEDFDLALWAAASHDWTLFRASGGVPAAQIDVAASKDVLAWGKPGPGFPLTASGLQIGELRLDLAALEPEVLDQVRLYTTFAGQAFEHYALRQAVLEQKAETLDFLPIGVARLDPGGHILEYNAQLSSLAGVRTDPIGLDAWAALFKHRGMARDDEWSAFLANPAAPSIFKIFCVRQGERGKELCVYLSAHRRVWQGRNEIILVLEDVTLVPSLEMQAIKQREFLERLMGSMRDLVMTVDAQGQIIYSSPGLSKSLLGRNLFEISTPRPPFVGSWSPKILPHPPGAVEVALNTGTTKAVPMEFVISPLTRMGISEHTYLVVGRDLSVIRRLEEKLKRQAMLDGLTQLLNHFQFHAALEREVMRAARTGRVVGLMFLDLDFFKRFNDTYGHQGGDEALRKVADILRHNSRRGMDMPCRYGGDEFAVIFTEIGRDTLQEIAGRIIEAFAQEWKGELGVSIGLAIIQPDEEPDRLIGRADSAAYAAKSAGGGHFVWAE